MGEGLIHMAQKKKTCKKIREVQELKQVITLTHDVGITHILLNSLVNSIAVFGNTFNFLEL